MSDQVEATKVAKTGGAGPVFPGSDSRKYNYFEPKGRKATHYEDMTLDVQPDPERYLLQDWIISFPDGTPTYSKTWTKAQSSNWHAFRAVDQEWERTHYQRQSTICGMIQSVIENGRKSGAALPLRQGVGENPAEPPRRLQARGVRPRHLDDAGAALRLHADDQFCDPDQLVLQAALRPGPDAVPVGDRPRPRGLRRQGRQDALDGRPDLAGHPQVDRDDHGLAGLPRAVPGGEPRVRASRRRAVPFGLRHAVRCRPG